MTSAPDDPLSPSASLKAAIFAKKNAQRMRYHASKSPDSLAAHNKVALERADSMDAIADEALAVPETLAKGAGGELIPPAGRNKLVLSHALKEPDMINLEASISRLDLVDQGGVLHEAIDAAESMGAKDAAEQMLCHQLPALHRAAMELIQKAGNVADVDRKCKMLNTSVRLMESMQKGMIALKTYRRGGEQIVKHIHVQHVQVQDGGKAIVGGSIQTGGKQIDEGGVD